MIGTQSVRLFDVFVLGPLMLYAAVQGRTLPDAARWTLGVSGIFTVLYNGSNYARVTRGEEPHP